MSEILTLQEFMADNTAEFKQEEIHHVFLHSSKKLSLVWSTEVGYENFRAYAQYLEEKEVVDSDVMESNDFAKSLMAVIGPKMSLTDLAALKEEIEAEEARHHAIKPNWE